MVTPTLLKSLYIRKNPIAQKVFAKILGVSYLFPSKTEIIVEGWENIPSEPCFLAMNHTDRYNYWPFQYAMARELNQYTCTWVKAKYFHNPFVRSFLLACNNIPIAPKGTLIAKAFVQRMNRKPSGEEYTHIQQFLQNPEHPHPSLQPFLGQNPLQIVEEIESQFASLSQEVVRLNKEALAQGHHILIFPQGTRSIRLSKGHVGLAQMSQRVQATIVPIGCSGSDLCHPGTNPWAKGGKITYRIGKPIPVTDERIRSFQVQDDFVPFSAQANKTYRHAFQSITDVVMDDINTLVDEPYRYSQNKESDGVQGVERFL